MLDAQRRIIEAVLSGKRITIFIPRHAGKNTARAALKKALETTTGNHTTPDMR